jgi:hypothetical protein
VGFDGFSVGFWWVGRHSHELKFRVRVSLLLFLSARGVDGCGVVVAHVVQLIPTACKCVNYAELVCEMVAGAWYLHGMQPHHSCV